MHRYAIIDTDTGEELRRYTSTDALRAKAHGRQAGCRLQLLPQVHQPSLYQRAVDLAAALGLSPAPF